MIKKIQEYLIRKNKELTNDIFHHPRKYILKMVGYSIPPALIIVYGTWVAATGEFNLVESHNRIKKQIFKGKISRLEEEILRKCQYEDGESGLSLKDKENLAKKLGFEGFVSEFDSMGIKPKDNKIYFVVGNKYMEIDEKGLKKYLEN
ncbi:hypothetical protein K8R47_03645 [archaeon]|nr:hypothetical protein [archaeon]